MEMRQDLGEENSLQHVGQEVVVAGSCVSRGASQLRADLEELSELDARRTGSVDVQPYL